MIIHCSFPKLHWVYTLQKGEPISRLLFYTMNLWWNKSSTMSELLFLCFSILNLFFCWTKILHILSGWQLCRNFISIDWLLATILPYSLLLPIAQPAYHQWTSLMSRFITFLLVFIQIFYHKYFNFKIWLLYFIA